MLRLLPDIAKNMPKEVSRLRQSHLHFALAKIYEDQKLYDRVRDKYSRKNTQGYSLNALIDYEKPIDILSDRHVLPPPACIRILGPYSASNHPGHERN